MVYRAAAVGDPRALVDKFTLLAEKKLDSSATVVPRIALGQVPSMLRMNPQPARVLLSLQSPDPLRNQTSRTYNSTRVLGILGRSYMHTVTHTDTAPPAIKNEQKSRALIFVCVPDGRPTDAQVLQAKCDARLPRRNRQNVLYTFDQTVRLCNKGELWNMAHRPPMHCPRTQTHAFVSNVSLTGRAR